MREPCPRCRHATSLRSSPRKRGPRFPGKTGFPLARERAAETSVPASSKFLLLRLRREALADVEIEHALGIEAEDVALRLLVEERQVPDRAREIHVPVRIVG